MTGKKVWFITGAGRGMGVHIARAALAAGNAVVATARNTDMVTLALGHDDDLLAVRLDVTDPADGEAAAQSALDRFGRIDVLVNNAGNFYAGFFEEISPEDFRAQIETTMFGPMNVTRAVLPVMPRSVPGSSSRSPRRRGSLDKSSARRTPLRSSGWKVGWSRSPPRSRRSASARCSSSPASSAPNSYRESTSYAASSIDDYAERTEQTVAAWNGMNGKQGGDPAKLAKALVQLANQDRPPLRWVAGADAVETAERKANELLAQVNEYRDLSSALAYDDPLE